LGRLDRLGRLGRQRRGDGRDFLKINNVHIDKFVMVWHYFN